MSKEFANEPNKQIITENKEIAYPDAVVDINRLVPESDPPKDFSKEELTELADSIKTHGMLFPVLVVERGDHFGIVAGERRWRAAKIAGLRDVPVIIRHYDEKELLEIALVENAKRPELTSAEEAHIYKELIEKYNYTLLELADVSSKSVVEIEHILSLL